MTFLRVAPLASLSLLFAGQAMAAAPAWVVDPARSSLAFSGTHTGARFAGKFTRFKAAIAFDPAHPDRAGAFIPLASGYGACDALPIRADAEVCGALLRARTTTVSDFEPGHSGDLVSATGSAIVGAERIDDREGLVLRDEPSITVDALTDVELVLIVTAEPAPERA